MFSLALTAAAVAGDSPHAIPLHAHHTHQPARSKVLTTLNGGNDIPADGAIFPTAMYYAFVQVGSPPRDFAVGLDSGSGDLFVEGKGCSGCTTGGPNAQYDPSRSSTSVPKGSFHHSYKTCNMKNPSASCTLSGNMYYDQVSLGGFGPVQVKVGAIQSQTTNFDTKKVVGGLMGLGGFDGEDVLATLSNAGKCDRIWGLCMNDEGSKSNGTMTVGGVDSNLADGPIKYVPNNGFIYDTVDVASMSVNGQTIAVNDGAILDSGTNILLLSPQVFSQVQSGMCSDSSLAHCSELWGTKCFSLSEAQVDQYPPLKLQLKGVTLEMSSREYLFQNSPVASSSGQYCLGIRNGGSTGFIIGASTMKNYYVVIDRKNSRVGWGKVNKQACGGSGSPAPVPPPPSPGPSPTPSPSPSGSHHYGQPPCKADEVEVQLGPGSVCAAPCADTSDCPSDVPAGTLATPQCDLLGNSHCGLKCGRDGGCPDGAICYKKPLSLTGSCIFSSAVTLV